MNEKFFIEIKDSKDIQLYTDVARLNDLLNRIGVQFEIDSAYTDTLVINVDNTKLHISTTRRAGRPATQTSKSVADVYKYRKSHNIFETAEYCGLSSATMNRRISKLKKKGLWRPDCDDFWTIDD